MNIRVIFFVLFIYYLIPANGEVTEVGRFIFSDDFIDSDEKSKSTEDLKQSQNADFIFSNDRGARNVQEENIESSTKDRPSRNTAYPFKKLESEDSTYVNSNGIWMESALDKAILRKRDNSIKAFTDPINSPTTDEVSTPNLSNIQNSHEPSTMDYSAKSPVFRRDIWESTTVSDQGDSNYTEESRFRRDAETTNNYPNEDMAGSTAENDSTTLVTEEQDSHNVTEKSEENLVDIMSQAISRCIHKSIKNVIGSVGKESMHRCQNKNHCSCAFFSKATSVENETSLYSQNCTVCHTFEKNCRTSCVLYFIELENKLPQMICNNSGDLDRTIAYLHTMNKDAHDYEWSGYMLPSPICCQDNKIITCPE